jgi:hypothetical protein
VAGAAGSRHCSVTLGYFAAELEAARAYDEVAGPLGRRTNGITWEQVAPMILAARRDLDHAERLKDRGAVVGAAKALEHLRAQLEAAKKESAEKIAKLKAKQKKSTDALKQQHKEELQRLHTRMPALEHADFTPSTVDMFRSFGQFPVDPRTRQLSFKEPSQGVRSLTFGYKYMCGENLTKATIEKYNDVKVLNAWASSILPSDFKYTSIVVLQNSKCPVHVDKNNMGVSAIITLGDHIGGELWVYNDDRSPLMCRNTPHLFDGKVPHATMPFKGERYSVVFYCRREVPAAKPDVRAQLEELGFPLPPVGPKPTETTTDKSILAEAREAFPTFMDKQPKLNFPEEGGDSDDDERRDTADCQRGLFRTVIRVEGKLGVTFEESRWVVAKVTERDGRGLLAEAMSSTGLKVRKGDTLVSVNGCAIDSMPDDRVRTLLGEHSRLRELRWLRREKRRRGGRGGRMLPEAVVLQHEAEVPRQRQRRREEAERKEKKRRKLQAERRRQQQLQMDGNLLGQGDSRTVDSRTEDAVEPDDMAPFRLVCWTELSQRRHHARKGHPMNSRPSS